MLTIGPIELESNVLLAPIAGYTDRAFRLMVRAAGHTGLAYTELIHAEGIRHHCRQARDIEFDDADDHTLGVQIYGNDVEWFREAALWAEGKGAKVIDINMGCPVDKVTKTNGGSMLLCDPDRTTRMVEPIVKLVGVPVTAKLRLGWDVDHLTAPRLARQLESVGVQMITIHGRTTKMRFKGKVKLDGIASVVAAVEQIPVIGNGDITSAADALEMLRVTGCAGVMVGRAAIRHPWLLREIEEVVRTKKSPTQFTVLEKSRLIRLHFSGMLRYQSEREALSVMRGRIAGYCKTLGSVRPIRERIRTMTGVDDFYGALDDLDAAVDPIWMRVPFGVFAQREATA